MRLEAADVFPVEVLGTRLALRGLLAEVERAADPLHVHADHAGGLALAAERRDREAGEVAHVAVPPGPDRLLDLPLQVLEVDAVAALEALLLETLLDRLRLDRAEEEAVEHELEHAAVLLRLGERGRERLAEVLAVGPAHLSERAERVQDLGAAELHTLAT